ncbi:MAG TPA: flagellar export chaperone FliS [Nocardioides sp.]|nr:flagellar export chaperone FliS [Nocardioides sp.]
MSYPTTARAAYVGNSVSTASPARLLVMLVERLVLDVERGLRAQVDGDFHEAHRHLVHAQDIVVELQTSLDVDKMPGGQELASLYEYLRTRLVTANVRRAPAATQQALVIARHLCDTWRQAAMAAATQ